MIQVTKSPTAILQRQSSFTAVAGSQKPYNFTTDITDHIKTNCSIWLPRENDFENKLAYTQALSKAINPDFFNENHGRFIADAKGDRAMQDERMEEVRVLEASLRKEGHGHGQNFSKSFPERLQRRLASYSIQLEVDHDTFSFSWMLNLLFIVFLFFYSRFRPTAASKPADQLTSFFDENKAGTAPKAYTQRGPPSGSPRPVPPGGPPRPP